MVENVMWQDFKSAMAVGDNESAGITLAQIIKEECPEAHDLMDHTDITEFCEAIEGEL